MSRPGKQAAAARLAVAVQLVGSVCALLLAVCLALSFTLLREGHFAACLKKSGYLDTLLCWTPAVSTLLPLERLPIRLPTL